MKKERKSKENEPTPEPKKRGRKPKKCDVEINQGIKSKKMKARIQETIVSLKKRDGARTQKPIANLILHIPIKSADVKEEDEIFSAVSKPSGLTGEHIHRIPNDNSISFEPQTPPSKAGSQVRAVPMKNGLYRVTTKKNLWPRYTDVRCWWCTYTFDGTPCSIPYKYEKDEFWVFGCFCTFECAMAYIIMMVKDKKWEKTSLLHLLYRCVFGRDEKIFPAPPKEILVDYGGKVTIQKFREDNRKISYDIVIPPIVSLSPQIEEHNMQDSIDQIERRPTIGMGSTMDDGTGEPNKLITVRRGRPIANSKKFLKHFIKA